MVLVGVGAIRLFYDWDCSGDMSLSIDSLVMTRDKPLTILDCANTPMDSSL